jgi:phage baseplate assembly protein W
MTLKGIAYPFRKDNGQFPAVDEDEECVKSDLIMLFRTPVRSRIMRPEYGTIVDRLVFESTGDLLNARLERTVKQAILVHENRVVVNSFTVETETNLITADIQYSVQGISDSVQIELESQV